MWIFVVLFSLAMSYITYPYARKWVEDMNDEIPGVEFPWTKGNMMTAIGTCLFFWWIIVFYKVMVFVESWDYWEKPSKF